MTSFQIKNIAILTMVIDHIGLFFFPQIELLRIIGRIAFPLFAWLIANGAYHTSSLEKYLTRLLYLALISQIPFTIANQNIGSPPFYLNVIFTLFLGLLAIYGIKKTENKLLWIPIIASCCAAATLLNCDYGTAGVLSVVCFYIFFNNKIIITLTQTILLLVLPLTVFLIETEWHKNLSFIYMNSLSEKYGLIALLFIFLYSNKKGEGNKYLFYLFYPVQYILIVIFQFILLR
jgi:hypothetical protein